MKARTKWLMVTGGSLVGMVACLFLSKPREPRYLNRPLSAWLGDLSNPNYETQRVARVAIQDMGAAAVPFLTNSLAQRNALSIRIYRKDILPRKLVSYMKRYAKWQTPMMESRNAAIALQTIGPAATNAIPSLMAAIQDPSYTVAQSAVVALGSMGSNAVPALMERLPVAPPNEQQWLLQAAGFLGTNAAPLAPILLQLSRSTNGSVGTFARFAIERAGINTNAVSTAK
jgi:hypothetical protein